MVRTPFQNGSIIGSGNGQDIRNARTSVIFMCGENIGNSRMAKLKGVSVRVSVLECGPDRSGPLWKFVGLPIRTRLEREGGCACGSGVSRVGKRSRAVGTALQDASAQE